ncbi:MAG: SDR family NAD(P)-dependent oxidoreductase [Pseudomonadota bacterium]
MSKTILITGSTDGIGWETAKSLAAQGHRVLLHGRSDEKLARAVSELTESSEQPVLGFQSDLADLSGQHSLAQQLLSSSIDIHVLINNAGVFKTQQPRLPSGLDARFVVNTLSPYKLVKQLLPYFPDGARVVNLSSAAQASLDLEALWGRKALSDGEAYAQSKLAITGWSHYLGRSLGNKQPAIIAVNPGSFLATKMVRDAYGSAGKDISTGVDILCRAALSDEFAEATGRYFDNDLGQFSDPHPDALDAQKNRVLIDAMEDILSGFST